MYEKPRLERFGTFRELTRGGICIPELTPGCNDEPPGNDRPNGDRS